MSSRSVDGPMVRGLQGPFLERSSVRKDKGRQIIKPHLFIEFKPTERWERRRSVAQRPPFTSSYHGRSPPSHPLFSHPPTILATSFVRSDETSYLNFPHLLPLFIDQCLTICTFRESLAHTHKHFPIMRPRRWTRQLRSQVLALRVMSEITRSEERRVGKEC